MADPIDPTLLAAAETNEGATEKTPLDRSFFASAKRITRTLVIGLAIAFSMLSFPSVLPWVLAAWLLWHTSLALRDRPAYLPLVVCLAIMVAKLVPRTPFILLFACLLLVIAIARFRGAGKETPHSRRVRAGTIVLWLSWGLLLLEWQRISDCGRPLVMDPSRPVVCLGDSLTQGMLPDHGYPDQLKEMIKLPVVNSGFSGISTTQGLGQLARVLDHNPQVVVIELGGHDFLKGHSRASTKRNLEELIRRSREHGAEVILMEIPRGFMFDPYASLEREVAYEHDVQLVADSAIRQLVIWSPVAPPGQWFPDSQLSDDGIHSNPRGSKAMAEYVADGLRRMFGEQVLADRVKSPN